MDLGDKNHKAVVFNVLARHQDDHTRNIAFLMEPDGRWRLAPAFDLIWSHNPEGKWTDSHQLRVNGKRDDFKNADLLAVFPSGELATTCRQILSALNSATGCCRIASGPRTINSR
jgi:serine/threonine-protein kinase HipA